MERCTRRRARRSRSSTSCWSPSSSTTRRTPCRRSLTASLSARGGAPARRPLRRDVRRATRWWRSSSSLCVACHGFSALVTGRRGPDTATVLFDVGPSADVWLGNAARLDIDLSDIDVLFVSHWHGDHTGGIPTVVGAIAEARAEAGRAAAPGRRTPGSARPPRHPDAGRDVRDAAGRADVGGDRGRRRSDRQARGGRHAVADGFFLSSGDIPRVTSYETGLAGHVTWRDGQAAPDPEIHDERFLAARVRGRGTTVLSACSHAGIVNVALEALRLVPEEPIDLLLGGYHLAGRGRRGPDRRHRPGPGRPRVTTHRLARVTAPAGEPPRALATAFAPRGLRLLRRRDALPSGRVRLRPRAGRDRSATHPGSRSLRPWPPSPSPASATTGRGSCRLSPPRSTPTEPAGSAARWRGWRASSPAS